MLWLGEAIWLRGYGHPDVLDHRAAFPNWLPWDLAAVLISYVRFLGLQSLCQAGLLCSVYTRQTSLLVSFPLKP